MFTFADTPVKFLGLLLLFAWCTAWCGYELTRPQSGRQRVSNVLHLAMAVVMLLMVARPTWTMLVSVVPDAWLAIGFGLAGVWFIALSVQAFAGGERAAGWYSLGHAAMFGAMTWHLAAMAVMSAAMAGMGGHGEMGGGMGGGMAGPMDMGAWMAEQSRPGGTVWIIALIGLPFMTYLLVSSLHSAWLVTRPAAATHNCPCGPGCTCGTECACSATHRVAGQRTLVGPDGSAIAVADQPVAGMALTCHEVRPQGSTRYRLAHTADFAMNFGMFWMSTGLLVPLLPFFAALAF
ncbi:MAG: DUF5134 domain-containing protein [Micropruina sp.]|nr:DUF5134 domain-containing protein [Micropruina sp.]